MEDAVRQAIVEAFSMALGALESLETAFDDIENPKQLEMREKQSAYFTEQGSSHPPLSPAFRHAHAIGAVKHHIGKLVAHMLLGDQIETKSLSFPDGFLQTMEQSQMGYIKKTLGGYWKYCNWKVLDESTSESELKGHKVHAVCERETEERRQARLRAREDKDASP